MGTTIKREPVSFNIPKSPDYKFLNITEFGGLSVSSNPFVVSSNTASDCLNVYVDEDNALSTRPRLQPKWDLVSESKSNPDVEIIGVYNLHKGYLLHYKTIVDNVYHMMSFDEQTYPGFLSRSSEIKTSNGGHIPTSKCSVFEQNDIVYVLDGEQYQQITNSTTISPIEGYVPTVRVGGTNRIEGKEHESLNLLSYNFKETYFWDGRWMLSDIGAHQTEVDNGYIETYALTFKEGTKPLKTYVASSGTRQLMYKDDSDVSRVYQAWFPTSSSTVPQGHGAMSKPSDAPTANGDIYADISQDGKVLVYCYTGAESGLFVRRNYVWSKLSSDTDSFNSSRTIGVVISDSGDAIATYTTSHVLIAIWNGSDYNVSRYPLASDAETLNASIAIDNSGSVVVVKYKHSSGAQGDVITTIKNGVATTLEGTSQQFGDMALSKSGNYFALIDNTSKHVRLYTNYTNNNEYKQIFEQLNQPKQISLTFATDRLYCNSSYNYTEDNGWYWLDTGLTIYYDTLESERLMLDSFAFDVLPQASDNTLILPYKHGALWVYGVITFNFASTQPLLTVTRTMSKEGQQHPDEDSRFDIYNKFRRAMLYKRFNNNTWFASGNYTFHTQYNDPTYIPLSSYNDLGEDYEEITGLGIVNDNVLVAYKRNRLYIITPITVGDTLTYSYTETKNVIGNDVVNAPILTTLTEMPTQVSYDGIFALNQLQNVQSGDRITTLISDNINPRWLKESKTDIDRTITLNRLYWTYYILPHDEKTTKIYLLDNRTQQWYYWELPIFVVSAMIKDNKTHFADANGRIYTLETSDTINEYNADVTEYYDKINNKKLLIPWHWYSQILSLNTINYSKKLVDTTFILTDTDTQDEYGLDYSFIAWRKSVSETNKTTISNKINYVQSTTKRTMIPRFNFIQFRLSNTSDDLDNNKLRLVGLGLKYVLLEGLY